MLQPVTWWRRVLTLAVALVLFGFVYLSRCRWATANRLGQELFNVLSSLGFFYVLLARPQATVDCRERCDGTLTALAGWKDATSCRGEC